MATTPAKRACPECGTLLPEEGEFCPVCALQQAVETQSESMFGTSSELRFEHYTVLKNEDGTPMELGRGGMGVTYKAIDTHLRCPVALKIIRAQFIRNESARSRFLREARAAASVRHPNVATVHHLGESGGNYFYAMEFVDGETLEALLHRRGRLEIDLALEIVTQVAAGLTAIHKQHLVHRDIKPSNVMVTWEEGRWEKCTAGLERASTLDPRNPEILDSLAYNYLCLRRYRDSERIQDRLIELEPDQPWFPIDKAKSAFLEKADLTRVRAAYEALPPSIKDDLSQTENRVYYAMCARDFDAASEMVTKSPNEEIFFLGAGTQNSSLVPRQIVTLWLELVRGNQPNIQDFGAAREQLYRKVQADRTDPFLLTALALADVALGRKEESVKEGRRAMQMRSISDDAVDGAVIAANIAIVYAWANQSDLAFEQLDILIKMPAFLLSFGNLKTNPSWNPLRKDPRFDKLLAELAPHD